MTTSIAIGACFACSSASAASAQIDTAAPGVHRSSNALLQAKSRLAAIPNLATGSRITQWTVEVSTDGQQWHSVYQGSKAAGVDDTQTRIELPQAVAARHVKLVIDAAVDAPSLYELRLHAPASTHAQPSATAATLDAHDAKFPPATLQFLKTNTGLNGEQWDNIMQVVNKPAFAASIPPSRLARLSMRR